MPASQQPASFSQQLRELAERFGERAVQLGEIFKATRGRGYNLLLMLLVLPFLTPIPLPGISTVFGLVVAVIGARTALGQKPWLPQKLLQRTLPPGFLTKLIKAASWLVHWLEYLLRPRLTSMTDNVLSRRLAGIFIALSGLLLAFPLPVPFSNFLPAFTVLLLAAAALEKDGLAFLAGCAMFLVTVAFFLLLAFGGLQGLQKLKP